MYNGGGSILEKILTLEGLPNGTKVEKTLIPIYEITYMSSSGFGVYVCEDESEIPFNIKGTFVSPLITGQTYFVQGKVSTYSSSYGVEKQIAVDVIRNTRPVNAKGIIAYL